MFLFRQENVNCIVIINNFCALDMLEKQKIRENQIIKKQKVGKDAHQAEIKEKYKKALYHRENTKK